MDKGTDFDIGQFKKQYSGLRNAPLEVWIAEFLKRNEEFQRDCRGVDAYRSRRKAHGKNALPDSIIPPDVVWRTWLQQKYRMQLLNWEPEKQTRGLKLTVILPPPVRGIRIVTPRSDTTTSKIAAAAREARPWGGPGSNPLIDLRDQRLGIIGQQPGLKRELSINGGPLTERDLSHAAMDDLLGHDPDRSGAYAVPDTLLLAIDLRRKGMEIRDIIDKFLKIHLLPPEKRQLPDNWLSYLMVYDLRKMKKSNDEISDIMHEVTPDKRRRVIKTSTEANTVLPDRSEHFFEEFENIENHYESADKLIHGGYKDFL